MEKSFLNADFKINSWDDVKIYFNELIAKKITNADELSDLIVDFSKLTEAFQEDFGWAYINMTRDTANKEYKERFNLFNQVIYPEYSKATFEIIKKIAYCEFSKELSEGKWALFLKRNMIGVKLFKEANIPLNTEIADLNVKYQELTGGGLISFQGKEYTFSQMAKFMESKDRDVRKEAFEKMVEKRLSMKDELNVIFDKLIKLREKCASNAGYDNYTDFRFKEMERIDYGVKECRIFNESVLEVSTEYLKKIYDSNKKSLGVFKLYPYDAHATMPDDAVLKPFSDVSDFIGKSEKVFDSVDKRFGDIFRSVVKKGYIDLESRKGKAPGGYNYPLYKAGLPFIFMNASGVQTDMRTLMHETGHAVHTVCVKDMFSYFYKNTPSEVAELASMAMEMITFDKWGIFYEDEKSLKQAQKKQLEGIITFFSWCAVVDKFQQWIYAHKNHTIAERENFFENLVKEYGEKYFEWSDYNEYLRSLWQKQLHIFEVPYYYIEYGFAQMGALQIWKNYMKDPKNTIEKYIKALSLGSSVSISDVYNCAGISFDFSKEKLSEVLSFAYEEYEKLQS